MNNLKAAFLDIWRLSVPYFRDDTKNEVKLLGFIRFRVKEKYVGRLLLAVIVALNIFQVYLEVQFNEWNGQFYSALQDHNSAVFFEQLKVFSVLAVIWIARAVYELYLTQILIIRWRRSATERLTALWLKGHQHYRLRLRGQPTDNPDQRIAEDIALFVERTITLAMQIFVSVLSLWAFVVILWGLSATFPYTLWGVNISAVPGYLVWFALAYAVFGTVVTHYIARPLVQVNFDKQRREADYRYALMRVRENGEEIALLDGEAAEDKTLRGRFTAIMHNWTDYMRYTKRYTWFTSFQQQFAIIFPFLLLAPAYFSTNMALGVLTRTSGAVSQVQGALSLIINIYRELASYRSVVNRLTSFEADMAAEGAEGISRLGEIESDGIILLSDVTLTTFHGQPLVEAPHLLLRKGESVAVTGPSGSGKSTLFRAIAGIWPYGGGTIARPKGETIMLLPQKPYLPQGTLRQALLYPHQSGFADSEIIAMMEQVGLGRHIPRLDEEAAWNQTLSLGEQQRLSILRAIIAKPDWLFLDETTASVDEAAEAALYRLLREKLPDTTIVTIAHRSTLMALHERRITLAPDPVGTRVFRVEA